MAFETKSSLVVYTAIANKYDFLREVPECLKAFTFICFTDKESVNPKNTHGWQIRFFPNEGSDPTRRCRDLKINPHKYLPEYQYSLWVDSSIQLYDHIYTLLINMLSKEIKISALKHRFRDCVYEEARVCSELLRDDPTRISSQVEFLRTQGYPSNNGLAETGLLFRHHMDPTVIRTMDLWNDLLVRYSKRDQLGFNYALWETDIPFSPINASTRDNNPMFRIGRHRASGLRDLRVYIEAYSYINPILRGVDHLLVRARKLHQKFQRWRFVPTHKI